MRAHPFQALPARTPAPPVLRCFVFQYLEGGRFKIVRAYLCGGVQKIETGTPMLRGAHFFLCFPCSVALRILTFSTPLRPECSFCLWADELALSCCVALVIFCASHARWRCEFLLFQPLCGENACFACRIKTGTPVLRGVRFCLCFSCSVALLIPISLCSFC